MRCLHWMLLALVMSPFASRPSVATEPAAPLTVAAPCDSGCSGGCDCGCCDDRLFSLIGHSDSCFTDFISPMTNPVYFEDPRTLTEARVIFVQHKLPPALGSGDVQVIACQLRAALTDRLSLVASKDGFIIAGDDAPHGDGWADVAVGLKYNIFCDVECQQIASAGFHYEMPVGSPRALQGNGDGIWHMYLTGGMEIGDCAHLVSAAGLKLASDPHANSRMGYWSTHVDKRICGTNLYGLAEVNWNHWIGSGDNTALAGVEGLDFYNFGSTGVEGHDIVTAAIGVKYKPCDLRELGLAWEVPLTDRRDIIDNRITVDLCLRY